MLLDFIDTVLKLKRERVKEQLNHLHKTPETFLFFHKNFKGQKYVRTFPCIKKIHRKIHKICKFWSDITNAFFMI